MAPPHDDNNNNSNSSNATTMTTASMIELLSQPRRRHRGGLGNQQRLPASFHPDFMFCGECTVCDDDIHRNLDPSAPTTRTVLRLHHHHGKSPQHSRVIQTLLEGLSGVENVIVKLEESLVTVDHSETISYALLLSELKAGGFPATLVDANNEGSNDCDRDNEPMRRSKDGRRIIKSTLFVQGICCASEVPSVNKIVRQQYGATHVQVNIPQKRVYVHHDDTIDITRIAEGLSKAGFLAKVLKNGAIVENNINDGTNNTGIGRSTFHVQQHALLLEQDIPKLQARLMASVEGIRNVEVNVDESVIFVDHDIQVLSAAQVQVYLEQQGMTHAISLIQDGEAELLGRNSKLWSQPRSQYVESTLMITNLTKQHVPVLKKAIQQSFIRAHVRTVHPHAASHTVKVEHNPELCSAQSICDALSRYGLYGQVVSDGAVDKLYLPLIDDEATDEELKAAAVLEEWETQTLQLHVILSGIFWVISMLSAIGGVWTYLQYAGLLSVLFGLPPVAIKAWRTIRRWEFDANCMMVIAAMGALALGEFDEAASVSFLFSISEFLESRATSRARKALKEIFELKPEHAHVIHPETKELIVVSAEKVPIGSLISVRTGDKIAADGVVVEGTSSVDESSLTGESTPVRKTVDSTVSGGSINIGNTQLVVRTTTSVEDSAVSRLVRLVEEAQANRSPTETMIDGFARAYTPIVIVLAALMATIPWIWGVEVGRHWSLNALVLVVVACPCALTISTPVTYAAALAATAQRGIVVKGGASLEALGSVDKVVLDKTGTLTEGSFTVAHLEEIGEIRTRKEMLSLLALMEAPSSHPLSATLVKAAKREGVSVPTNADVREHTILQGEGVEATIDGKQTFVGNRRLFMRLDMYDDLPQASRDRAEEWSNKGGSVGFIGVEGEGIIGAFCMIDQIRSEAPEVIKTLLLDHYDVILLTGDGAGAARSVARQVGIPLSNVHSHLLPEDKLHFVSGLKRPAPKNSFGLFRRHPKVLFLGDGVNDAAALAIADVGVSMGEGAAVAMEMSDVTLMDSNLTKLLYALRIGWRVRITIRENIIISMICKIAVVALAFAGYMTLLYAIASDVGVMLLVTLNGMKLLPGASDSALAQCSVRRHDRNVYQGIEPTFLAEPTETLEIV